MREQIKVDDITLSLLITDAVTNTELKTILLCSVRKSETPNFDFIINAQNKLIAFEIFCNEMQKKLEDLNLKMFSYEWKWKYQLAVNSLQIWERLESMGEVYISWEVGHTYHYEEIPMRRIPINHKNTKPIIWMEEKSH